MAANINSAEGRIGGSAMSTLWPAKLSLAATALPANWQLVTYGKPLPAEHPLATIPPGDSEPALTEPTSPEATEHAADEPAALGIAQSETDRITVAQCAPPAPPVTLWRARNIDIFHVSSPPVQRRYYLRVWSGVR